MARRSGLLLLVTLGLAVTVSAPLLAHRPGEGYIFIYRDQSALGGRIEFRLEDLDRGVPLDGDGDGSVSEAEFEAAYGSVEAYVHERVLLGTASTDYELEFVSHDVEIYPVGRFARLHFRIRGLSEPPDLLEVEYRALFDVIPDHRGFLVVERNVLTGIEDNEVIPSLIFSPGAPRQATDLTRVPTTDGFIAFLRHGIWHIWIGIDHILFVLSLVMASVLRRPAGNDHAWTPVEGFVPALTNLAKVVTLFTVAHTITLTLAGLGLVTLSPRFVESIIALSVVAAALNNIRPLFGGWTWTIVFGFGLFHGFGFASVLGHLTQNQAGLVITLLGFNIGVEIGQLAVIAVTFPLLFALRTSAAYTKLLLPTGSAAIALLAIVWFVQRAFEI